MESYNIFEWLTLRKFCFVYPLKNGIKMLALVSFVGSIIIINHLIINEIELNQCKGYNSITDLLKCTKGEKYSNLLAKKETDFLRHHMSKHLIVTQACMAFTSTMLVWFEEKPTLTLLWASCKIVVGATELIYLPQWISKLISLTFSTSINPAWLTATFIVCNGYSVLVAHGYYSELVGDSAASYDFELKNIDPIPAVEIPPPPALPSS